VGCFFLRGGEGRRGGERERERRVCRTSKLSLKLGMKESFVVRYEKYHLFRTAGLLYIDDVPLGILRSPMLLPLRPFRDAHRLVTPLLLLPPLHRLPSATILTNPDKSHTTIMLNKPIHILPQRTAPRLLIIGEPHAGIDLVAL